MKLRSFLILLLIALFSVAAFGQDENAKKDEKETSIGGAQHSSDIYGVKIGMTVPEALEAVFVNAERKPGEEKPDAQRREGKNNADIRVVYNSLPLGELQIVFEGGKIVREVALFYKSRPSIESLRLASSSDIGVAATGERFDDRYSIGFVDRKKQEKLWWRDEKSGDYEIRVSFISGNSLKDGQLWWQTIAVKALGVKPGKEKQFRKAFGLD
ncbi:MAG: hypothetical protein R2684_05775 [Pyrinomonadaceae bacterium]